MGTFSLPPTPLRRALVALAALCAAPWVPLACSAEPVDLVGTWYVLAHYRDTDTANPDVYRWEDRIWIIERKGSRLEWTEYPIVVFEEQEGRFERGESGTRGRVLHAWEPNGAQQKEIDRGLQVNPRGKKRKTLRNKQGLYESVSASAGISASQITYHEAWSIADPTGLPVFQRVDSLGSARSETMDGITRFSVTEVRTGGNELRGTFERDLSRRGRFRMMRAGDVIGVPKRKKRPERDPEAGDVGRLEAPLTPGERRELDRFRERVRELDALAGGSPALSGTAREPSERADEAEAPRP